MSKTFKLAGFSLVLALLLAVSMASALTLPPEVLKGVAPADINLKDSNYCEGTEETTVTITINGAGGAATQAAPKDVVFGIDSSGSMGWNDPTNLRLDAAKDFVDKMDPSVDQGGVVSWDDNIDFTYGLSSDFPTLKNQIDNVDSSGGTNLNVGLNACIAMLDANIRVGPSSEVIIFLSNGAGTYTPSGDPGSPADDAASKGYVIYTIGLGDAPAVAALQDIADTTGGQYYSSPTPENLQAIFDDIFTAVIISTIPYQIDVTEVTQSYIVDEGNFNIAPSSVVTVAGITTITWLDVATHVGNNDSGLEDGEQVVLSFTAKCNEAGLSKEVEVLPGAKVDYSDNNGNYVDAVPIPQDYINVAMPAYFDIKPASCPNPFNPKSKGVVPFGIVGTPDLDVTQIDPMSIVLTGPLGDTLDANDPSYKWEIKDSTEPPPTDDKCYPCFQGMPTVLPDGTVVPYGGDGIYDFIFYFDNDAVETILDLGSYADGDPIPVELDAALLDGTPIVGKDQFLLRKKGKPAPESVAFAMESPYPLPFNPEVWIPYRLGATVDVDIVIHDISGRLIRTLRLGYRGAGAYTTKDKAAYWDGRNESGEEVSSGIYFCTLKAGDFIATRKLVMVR